MSRHEFQRGLFLGIWLLQAPGLGSKRAQRAHALAHATSHDRRVAPTVATAPPPNRPSVSSASPRSPPKRARQQQQQLFHPPSRPASAYGSAENSELVVRRSYKACSIICSLSFPFQPFQHAFIKVEDKSGLYRAMWREYKPTSSGECGFPRLNYDSRKGGG